MSKGREVNKTELSKILGFSERTLTTWQGEGMPILVKGEGKGYSNTYNTADVIKWMLARSESQGPESPKDRLDRLKGDQVEVQIAKELAMLATPEEYEQEWTGAVEAANEVLLMMTDLVVSKGKAKHGIEIPRELILEQVEEAIGKLRDLGDLDDGLEGFEDSDLSEDEEEGDPE